MVQAIGGAAGSDTKNKDGAAAAASLEAQLLRYQKQLSDCVNCDSSKTPEGKAQIQAIASKISEVKDRIDHSTDTKVDGRAGKLAGDASKDGSVDGAASTQPGAAPAPKAVDASATVGSVVDVYA
ncbi:MAG TPA: hypothetical protein DCW29_11655 [Janthinobacterium sp.]|nr:hypothetical protein [Janthinobacterium sp.]